MGFRMPTNAGIELRITYDVPMVGNLPTISFSPDGAGTLIFNAV